VNITNKNRTKVALLVRFYLLAGLISTQETKIIVSLGCITCSKAGGAWLQKASLLKGLVAKAMALPLPAAAGALVFVTCSNAAGAQLQKAGLLKG